MFSVIDNYKVYEESHAIILCDDQRELQSQTYKEVICLSDLITTTLNKYISKRNICLGLFMNHNIYIPSIILSLLKLKNAFTFVTVKNLNRNIANLKLSWILSLDDIRDFENFKEILKISLKDNKKLILWRRDPIFEDVGYQDILCVVQTSGSTGESKIIKVPHSCIESNVLALRKSFQINSNDVIYWGTPLTFDPSLVELLLSLLTGATLLIVPYSVSVNPYSLYKALFTVKKITVLQIVPSVFLRWRDDQIKDILYRSQLRILAFGGEAFPKRILSYNRSSNLRMFNLYGITEVSCWATVHEIGDESCDDDIPVGQNLDETLLELRNKEGKIVTDGKGEIFIGSSNRICFLNEEKPEKLCKPVFRSTGDIANINRKGIFVIGRKNKIIKRFGHRINLGKMEGTIFKVTSLESRCIWSIENSKLLTFILIKNIDVTAKKKTVDKIRAKLVSVLPEESFPDFIEIIENFPLTSHGKVDEKVLERQYFTQKSDLTIVDTFNNLWCQYFGINVEDLEKVQNISFFEMGGSSIGALRFIKELEEVGDLECTDEVYKNIFENSMEDCLNCLKRIEPTRKRHREVVNDGHVRKKEKGVSDELEIVWSYDLRACVDVSPLVFEKEGSVYVSVGSFAHIFVILNEMGEKVHKLILPESIETTPATMPCGKLLVGCFNGTLYCIDFLMKNIVWEYATSGKIKGTACYCKSQSIIIFGSYDKTVYCVSASSGHLLWKTLLDGSVASNPVYKESINKIFTATTAGTCFCLANTGEILWKYNCGGPVFGTPCIVNSNQCIVFPVVQGVLHCLSLDGKLLWKFHANGYVFSSLVLYKDCLVFGCHDKNIYVVKTSLSSCDIAGKIVLESEISTSPYICDINGKDVIVAACNTGIIYVIDFTGYVVLCRLQLAGEVFSSPVVYGSKIYVGCRDNNLHCIKVKPLK